MGLLRSIITDSISNAVSDIGTSVIENTALATLEASAVATDAAITVAGNHKIKKIIKNSGKTGKTTSLYNFDWYKGQDVYEAKNTLSMVGFTNIVLQPLKNIRFKRSSKIDKVTKITIAGIKKFKAGEIFYKNAEVVIYYNSLIEKANKVLANKSNNSNVSIRPEKTYNATMDGNNINNFRSDNSGINTGTIKFCIFCGAKVNQKNSIFCSNCGNKLR